MPFREELSVNAKKTGSRFERPASFLKLGYVERHRRRLVPFIAVALVLHAVALLYSTLKKPEKQALKPIKTMFVIRQPRLTKPFQFEKKRIERRMLERKVVVQQPKQIRTLTRQINSPNLLGTVTAFSYNVDTGADYGEVSVEPPIRISTIRSSKEPEKRISMQQEFLNLNVLDTGKYKALVIQDPSDKRNITGFVKLALAWCNDLDPKLVEPLGTSAIRAISALVDAINRYTKIKAEVDERLRVDSRELFKTPFLYVTTIEPFELTEKEIQNLAEYMRSGGFVFADNGRPDLDYSPAAASLRKMFEDALGKDARWTIIPNDHPLYHCFFDFNDGPPPGYGIGITKKDERSSLWASGATKQFTSEPIPWLEGIFLEGRLVAVYADKAYGTIWGRGFNNEAQIRMGINIVIYALTQPGSIAQQQIDFYSTAR